MVSSVFILSAVISVVCSALLIRGYLKNGVRLLFWAGICFFAFALEGIVLFISEIVGADLTLLRLSIPLAGLFA